MAGIGSFRGSGRRIASGCGALDDLLGGGFSHGEVSLVYGEAATGKTTLAIACALNSLRGDPGARASYVDSDHKLSTGRLTQMAGPDAEGLLRRLMVWSPEDFTEQAGVIEELSQTTGGGDLVVVDSVTGLYRAETGESEETFSANKELNRQMGLIVEMARTTEAAVILTGQVRSILDETAQVEPVAPRLLRFWSDAILKLEALPAPGHRQATLEKPASIQAAARFMLTEGGVAEAG